MPASQVTVIGVDLGGTNVRACAYTKDGAQAGDRASNPSNAQDGTAAVVDAIFRTVDQARATAEFEPKAVGLAIPGHIDAHGGEVVWAPNFGETREGVFYHWTHVQIRDPLEARTGLKVVLGNDANAAAFGEYRFGSGKGVAKCLVLLTVGTGIGGGVVLGPEALHGDARGPVVLLGGNQGGAELGHLVLLHGGLDCNAGSYGSTEAYCQRDAIVRRAVHRLTRGRPSSMNDVVQGDYAKITPQLIAEAAEGGDEVAIEVWEEVGAWLGVAIGGLINVFAPDVFAIGGQIAKAGELLLTPARKAARNTAIPSLFQDARIVQAEQIEDAGILGAAALAMEAI